MGCLTADKGERAMCDVRLATCKEGQGNVDGPQTEGKWTLPGPWAKPELEAGTTDDPDR